MRTSDSLVSTETAPAVARSIPVEAVRIRIRGAALLYVALGVLVLFPSLMLVTPGLNVPSLKSPGTAANTTTNAPAAVVASRSSVSR